MEVHRQQLKLCFYDAPVLRPPSHQFLLSEMDEQELLGEVEGPEAVGAATSSSSSSSSTSHSERAVKGVFIQPRDHPWLGHVASEVQVSHGEATPLPSDQVVIEVSNLQTPQFSEENKCAAIAEQVHQVELSGEPAQVLLSKILEEESHGQSQPIQDYGMLQSQPPQLPHHLPRPSLRLLSDFMQWVGKVNHRSLPEPLSGGDFGNP